MTLPRLNNYRDSVSGFAAVPGWFHRLDLDLFELLLSAQLRDGVTGDMLEIGTYHGKSAIAMGYGLRDTGESLMVVDLFGTDQGVDQEGMDAYDGLTLEQFQRNYQLWHPHPPYVYAGASDQVDLHPCDRFRFAHIDGGHAYNVVSEDIRLVGPYMTPDGIVVIDDFNSVHTPGVAAAAWAAAEQHRFYPFLLSEAKMYAAVSESGYDEYNGVMANYESVKSEWHNIVGYDVLRIWQ